MGGMQNLLVVSKGPKWWVKIADFGISKRAIEGKTVLQTLAGTPAFAAPEVLGFFQPGKSPDRSYTNAVDIWSLAVIGFLILTGEAIFKDSRRLNQYVDGSFLFPSKALLDKEVSPQGCDFLKCLMAPTADDRPTAEESTQHPWLLTLKETSEIRRYSSLLSIWTCSPSFKLSHMTWLTLYAATSALWKLQEYPQTNKMQSRPPAGALGTSSLFKIQIKLRV